MNKDEDFVYRIIRACGSSTANSDINIFALERIIEDIKAEEREACAEIAKFATMHCIAEAIMRRGESDEHQRTS